MKKGYMYILECSDGSYYTGSTTNLELRLQQHQSGEGANHTKKRLPVTLVYYEEYSRIDEAFYREKQVQGWSRKKKEALINGNPELLPQLAVAYRDLKSSGGFENINGGFENINGGFESLNHQEDTVSSRTSDTVSLSASDAVTVPLPEALEGSEREALEDTVTQFKNEYK